jgi:uncharacterized protein
MQRKNNEWLYSPSDLIKFLENEAVTWFDRYDKERPGELVAEEDSADKQLIQTTGEKHECEVLQQLIAEGRDVADLSGATDSFEATLRAMNEGRGIVYQARLEYGNFAGYADFLIRVEGISELGSWHYEVWDTKLARSLKPYFAVQLCCYAEMLEAVQGRRPEHVGIMLGNGLREQLRTEDYLFYYRAVKRAFLAQQQMFDPDQRPTLSGMSDYGCWNGHVARDLEARDDLSGVANIRGGQIEKLRAAGISSVDDLAASDRETIVGIDAATFARLRSQARLQIASRGEVNPKYQLVPPDPERARLGLGSLPPESPKDECFDIEGYPLVDGGLEYLLGVALQQDGHVTFRDWWAHDRTQERAAFEAFVHWVHDRWHKDPTMHIYHYAPYETTALKRLMGRYACCEQEIDDLLRNHVFVDLYTVVRQALIVGEPAYSLKNIEHLYLTKRDGEIATAGDSMVYYHRWLQERDGSDWTVSRTLRFIRDYNEADCRSTWKMMEWLRAVQRTAAIPFVPAGEVKQPNPTTNERAALAEEMLAEIPQDRSENSEKWRVHSLLSHLLEFHRREDKPSWWFLFERAGMTEEELVGDPDCLGALERTARPPEIVKRSYRYEYRFDPLQESKLRTGKSCRFSHDIEIKIEIEQIDYNAGLIHFTLAKSRPAPPSRLSLIPDDLVPGKTIVDSIERTVRNYRSTGQLPSALQDFLYRIPPRLRGHAGGSIIPDGSDLLSAATDIVGRMSGTTLCIQGPPGCGKTYTGGELIASLLKSGKRVGVTSNSHKAICLLLKSAAEAADRIGLSFKGAKAGVDDDQEPIHKSIELLEENGDVFKLTTMPDLVGGTAWVFSRPEAVGRFDYLFVDEAGQVSVANLVGMAPATGNLVLLGDQMQLNQPVQGSHPGESGRSVLEYLLQDQSIIPPDRGVFLPYTWRMRSEVCRFISDGIYAGRLSPNPVANTRRIRFATGQGGRVHSESGLVYIPLDHDGNTYECSEEADLIAQVVRELCGHTLELPNEAPRALSLRDILIVAPFNLQVRKIQSAIPGIRVGTVDKFQGQQAPVVIFSMTASEGDASPRGIDFLFSRNRINVAISRAQVLAVIVSSSKLVRTRCTRMEQIRLVNLFCRATEAGQAVAASR